MSVRPGAPGTTEQSFLRRNATRLLALALIAALFGFARLPVRPRRLSSGLALAVTRPSTYTWILRRPATRPLRNLQIRRRPGSQYSAARRARVYRKAARRHVWTESETG